MSFEKILYTVWNFFYEFYTTIRETLHAKHIILFIPCYKQILSLKIYGTVTVNFEHLYFVSSSFFPIHLFCS